MSQCHIQATYESIWKPYYGNKIEMGKNSLLYIFSHHENIKIEMPYLAHKKVISLFGTYRVRKSNEFCMNSLD